MPYVLLNEGSEIKDSEKDSDQRINKVKIVLFLNIKDLALCKKHFNIMDGVFEGNGSQTG